MVYNFISVYNVIEKIYRDYDHQEELDVWDVVEWAAEALEFIGAGQQYERRVAEIDITNYIGKLPCNFHSQPMPSFNGRVMDLATGGYSPLKTHDSDTSIDSRVNSQPVTQNTFPNATSVDTKHAQRFNPTYYIKDGVIVTSVDEGTIHMEYRAIACDDEGFPKIPDLVSYRTAVATYVQMKLDHRDYRRARISRDIYKDSEFKWDKYCLQARAAANMPNLSYAESIKNMWVKLKPNQNSAQTFYNDLSIREMRKTK